MAVEGCAKLAKLLLFIVNFVIFLAGAACIGIAVYFLVDTSYTEVIVYLEAIDFTLIDNLVYVILGIGAFLFVIGFLGCYGAMKENKCLLVLYSVLLLVLLLGQVGIVAVAFVARSWAMNQLSYLMDDAMDGYEGYNGNDTVSTMWNILQVSYECCGVNNYTDWDTATWQSDLSMNPDSYLWPETCCVMDSNVDSFSITTDELTNCYADRIEPDTEYVNYEGCLTKLLDTIETYLLMAGGIMLGIVVFQFILLASACCIIHKADDDK